MQGRPVAFFKVSEDHMSYHMSKVYAALRGVVKNGYFTVRLTVQKANIFLVQKHCFKPFLVGQTFHICLRPDH